MHTHFRYSFFGYKRSDVEDFIEKKNQQAEKDRLQIAELEKQLLRAKHEIENLQADVQVYKSIRKMNRQCSTDEQ